MARSKTSKTININTSTSPIISDSSPPTSMMSTSNTPLSLIDFNISRIKHGQQTDSFIQARILDIKNNPHKFPDDVVNNQILYKLVSRGGSSKVKLPWIPTTMVHDILSAYHDHP
ncbi:unnamed protein product [Didymodactylos carnosus]|uniref:Uncharacterized protein n=1 Tax=Didymodactylos carnosus TaxID=1234261 RepID=A0A814TWZ1_9BILA|nr:unnamed protein product [Didymodactylos carnosus]CAF1167068.1 unnamed protein product [Didymodactylos carnosus]CAF3590315.1 unnamed protein product [Didymodactylos carnosus]CAF3930639.1 unnamed protein product [Didymodactylos carnosus]